METSQEHVAGIVDGSNLENVLQNTGQDRISSGRSDVPPAQEGQNLSPGLSDTRTSSSARANAPTKGDNSEENKPAEEHRIPNAVRTYANSSDNLGGQQSTASQCSSNTVGNSMFIGRENPEIAALDSLDALDSQKSSEKRTGAGIEEEVKSPATLCKQGEADGCQGRSAAVESVAGNNSDRHSEGTGVHDLSSEQDDLGSADAVLAVGSVTGHDPASMESQPPGSVEQFRRQKEHVSEPKSSHIELKTFSHETGLATSSDKEPVLMLYRRHHDDLLPREPSHLHNDDNSKVSRQESGQKQVYTKVDLSWASHQHKSHRHKANGSRVSLTGIHVTVSKPQKRKMVNMQSPRIQCCLCGCSVFSALIGMFMLSAGVCLVLNYNFLEVDTRGLPPNLHNDEGKKVVGIILICVGIAAMILGGLVSTLYFTSCGNRDSSQSIVGQQQQNGRVVENGRPPSRPSSREGHGHHSHHYGHHHHGNGATPSRGSPAPGGSRRSGSLPSLRRATVDPRSHGLPKDGAAFNGRSGAQSRTPPSSTRSHGQKSRHAKSRHHHHPPRYQTSLTPHPEEAGADSQSLGEARRSAASSGRSRFPNISGYINRGAELDDELIRGSLASGSSESSVTPSVTIKVDSSYLVSEAERAEDGALRGQTWQHTRTTERRIVSVTRIGGAHGEPDDEGSGRMSSSTVDSVDAYDPRPEYQDEKKALDRQMNKLLS